MTEPAGAEREAHPGCECDNTWMQPQWHRLSCPVHQRWARKLALNMANAIGGTIEQAAWLKWLADIGYGVDFTHQPPPPCTPEQLAEVYAERDGESVEDWATILRDGNTAGGWYGSGWYGNGRDHPTDQKD